MLGLKLGLENSKEIIEEVDPVEDTALFEDGTTATDEDGNEMIFD